MMTRWTNYAWMGKFWAALVDENNKVIRVHPIPFEDVNSSAGGVARLNARDQGFPLSTVDPSDEEKSRDARRSRIEELRAKRAAREAS